MPQENGTLSLNNGKRIQNSDLETLSLLPGSQSLRVRLLEHHNVLLKENKREGALIPLE